MPPIDWSQPGWPMLATLLLTGVALVIGGLIAGLRWAWYRRGYSRGYERGVEAGRKQARW